MFKPLAFVALLAATTPSFATVINFDEVSHGTLISTQYSALGLTISAYENGFKLTDGPKALNQWSATINTLGRANNALFNINGSNSRPDILRFDFTGTASNISWLQNNEGGLVPRWEAYDKSGNLLSSLNFGSQSNWHAAGFAALGGVAYLLAYQPSDTWTWAIDNFSYSLEQNRSVSAPFTLALFGLGFIGLGMVRRQKAI